MFYRLLLILSLGLILFSCKGPESEEPGIEFKVELTEAEKEAGILTPEILWKFGRVSGGSLSPDGKQVVYSVTRYSLMENKGTTDIYITTTGGQGTAAAVIEDGFSNSQPVFLPGKDRIGFISNRSGSSQLWEIDPDGSDLKQITDVEGGIGFFRYSPDLLHFLYTREVKLEPTPREIYPDLPQTKVRIIGDLMYRHWDSWHDYSYSHIFVAPYRGKVTGGKDIMKDEPWDAPLAPFPDPAEFCWSPDGKEIAYTCKKMKGRDYAVSTNSDIYLYDLETEETRNLTTGMPGYDKYPVFSSNGNKIAWQSMATPGYEADKDRLFVMDLLTGEKEYLTKDFDQNVSNLTWSEDDRHLYFISGIHATCQVYRMDLETRQIGQITEGVHDYISIHLKDGILCGTKMSMSMAPEIFKIDTESGAETQLTFTNQHIYDHIKMGRVEESWIPTTDGKEMLVWVIYPPNFDMDKKYPALLYCQGGPQSAVSQFFSFRWNFQIMAANDYIIVAPNRRGLPTFGTEWNQQISGDYGGQNMKDYLSAIDAMKEQDYIDENRLGAVGASYGGYSVFYLAGHHEGRFRTFISHCGIYNLVSMYGATEEAFFVNHDLEGPYWEDPRSRSYDFSPHLYVQNWDTPIMIITGARDYRVPYTQSLEAFNAAQLRGIPGKLLFFPEESHFVLKPQNAVLWQREFFGWLDKYLKF